MKNLGKNLLIFTILLAPLFFTSCQEDSINLPDYNYFNTDDDDEMEEGIISE